MATPVTVVLQTRLTKKDHAALKKAAKTAEISVSAIIRSIIKEFLKKG